MRCCVSMWAIKRLDLNKRQEKSVLDTATDILQVHSHMCNKRMTSYPLHARDRLLNGFSLFWVLQRILWPKDDKWLRQPFCISPIGYANFQKLVTLTIHDLSVTKIDTILQIFAYACAIRYADFIRFSEEPNLE